MTSFIQAVGFAANGLRLAFRHHTNIKRQIIVAFFVVILGLLLSLSAIEWALLTITIAMVFLAEFMNTVVEEVVNLITIEYHKQAKIAKDIAAGMVLLTSVMSLIVGALLFIPKFFK